MSYRNKTYVIFDGDNDMWAYGYMKGWKKNQNINFNFHDAHNLNTITGQSSEENTKRKLRTRLSNTKQAIVLIGESTRYLYKFVRWEIEIAQNLNLPIVAVNLNGKRHYDDQCCPAILNRADAIHVSFKLAIIKFALDNFCPYYGNYYGKSVNYYYYDHVYQGLGL